MTWLKQSTAITIKLGPFVDEDDGKTAETGLTIVHGDVRVSKNGGNMAQKNESTSLTHDEIGMYDCPLDTTDTGTLGSLLIAVHESGALPVFQYFMVVPANVWDSIFGSDKLDVSLVQWLGTAPLALTGQLVQAQAEQLAAQAKADVNAEADAALSDYDPPTKAEMDAGHGLLATESKQDTIDTVVDAIKTITDALPDSGALSDLATILSGLVTVDTEIGVIDGIVDAILADTGELQADDLPGLIAALNNLSAAAVNAEVDTALADVDLDRFVSLKSTVDDSVVPPTANLIYTDIAEATDDHFNGMVMLFTSGVLVGQSRRIDDYWGGGVISVRPAFTDAPSDPDTFIIYGCQTVDVAPGGIGPQSLLVGTFEASKIATSAFTADKFHTDTHSYQAKVWLIDDDGSGNDRYAVAWYENGNFLASGVSNVTLWVFSTGAADLIGTSGAPQAMTEVASTHIFKYDEGSDRIVDGVAYIARVQATIGVGTKTWMQPVGRDSS